VAGEYAAGLLKVQRSLLGLVRRRLIWSGCFGLRVELGSAFADFFRDIDGLQLSMALIVIRQLLMGERPYIIGSGLRRRKRTSIKLRNRRQMQGVARHCPRKPTPGGGDQVVRGKRSFRCYLRLLATKRSIWISPSVTRWILGV